MSTLAQRILLLLAEVEELAVVAGPLAGPILPEQQYASSVIDELQHLLDWLG